MFTSSRPQSGANFPPSDFSTAFNTPTLANPVPESQDPFQQDPSPPTPGTPVPRNVHTPLPAEGDVLVPPRALGSASNLSNRDSYGPSSINNSHLLAGQTTENDAEKEGRSPPQKRTSIFRRPMFLLAALAALIVIILAVILPVYFTVIKKKGGSTSGGDHGTSPSSPGGGPGGSSSTATSGGDGSTVTTDTGDQFTYKNPFGGFWVQDPNDPFNNNAQANSWTPPLNTSWTWGKDKIYGVNLGGLFVLEPFISPTLYQKYPNAVDEWTLSQMMAADTASGGMSQLEDHYKNFITEQDIAEIAGAGLNWIRLPIPYWAIEVWDGEPFLAKVSWKYILRLLGWARKYGIRVNLDLHSIPGSQNGYNHSGMFKVINFLNGAMGIANAQRTLGYLRIITEFISQPEYANLIPIFGIMNEPSLRVIGQDILESFYFETYKMMRGITGIGAGKGPYMSIHDFGVAPSWAGFISGADRVALDTHPYVAFNSQPNTAPISTSTGADAGGTWPAIACNGWGDMVNTSQKAFGVTVAGEFSNAVNDCGLFVKAAGIPVTYGGDCSYWRDASLWNETTKAGVQAWAMASMDAFQNWFFWTWKVGNSTAGKVEAPLWSYQLGLQLGFMPADPRQATGKCASLGIQGTPFDGEYLPWQTGGVGAGTISPSASAAVIPWPPASINGAADASLLPVYTATGTVATLPPATFTATPSVSAGNGWFNAGDTAGGFTTISGCDYPDPWGAQSLAAPPACAAATAPYSVAAAAPIVTAAP